MIRKLLPLLFIISMINTGCRIDGCTDPLALNFRPSADNEDGSCRYGGDVVFWYGESTDQFLEDAEFEELRFYIDGVLTTTHDLSMYWNEAPDCGDLNSITISRVLDGGFGSSVYYEVTGEFDYVFWSGYADFEPSACQAIELDF